MGFGSVKLKQMVLFYQIPEQDSVCHSVCWDIVQKLLV